MLTVAKNYIKDYHKKRLQHLPVSAALAPAQLAGAAITMDEYDYSKIEQLAQEMIYHLPGKQQQVLQYKWNGLTPQQTAVQMQISIGAVHKNTYEARKRILATILP